MGGAENQIWRPPASSVEEGLIKEQWRLPALLSGRKLPAPALVLTPDNSVPSHLSLAPFEPLSRGCNSERASPIKSERRPFKRHGRRFQQRFLPPQPPAPLVSAAGSYAAFSSRHWSPGRGTCCGAATPHSSGGASAAEVSPPIFTHHTWVWDQRFLVSAPPTSLDVHSSLSL